MNTSAEKEKQLLYTINGEKMSRSEFIKRTQIRRMTMKELNEHLGFIVEIIE
jgi:hypothetical protein